MAQATLPETKHTPGPWKASLSQTSDGSDFWSVHGGDEARDAVTYMTLNQHGQLAANAALIARAPDLLAENERLREALWWLASFADVRSQDDSKTFARVNRGALRTIRDRAAAALSEQEGK